MIRSFVRWMHRVLPPRWLVVTVVGSLIAVNVCQWCIVGFVGGWDALQLGLDDDLLRARMAVACLAAIGYGASRIGFFHPAFSLAYYQWLRRTPWNARKPLPVGPVHLVPQDLIVLIGIYAFTYGLPGLWLIVPAAFLVAYLGGLAYSFRLTGLWGTAYVVLFGFVLALWLSVWPAVALGVLCALYGVARIGIRRSLERFPWDVSAWHHFQVDSREGGLHVDGRTEPKLGWPYDLLRARPVGRAIARHDGLFAPLFAASCVWVVIATLGRQGAGSDTERFGAMMFTVIAFACILARLFAYLGNFWSPIGLWGRFATGRWIIPGYDRVFVAPGLSLIAMVAVLTLAELTAGSAAFFFPLGTALVMFITLNMGPSSRQWQLTGNHRIVDVPFGDAGTPQSWKLQRAKSNREFPDRRSG